LPRTNSCARQPRAIDTSLKSTRFRILDLFPKRFVRKCSVEHRAVYEVEILSNPECQYHHQNPFRSTLFLRH
jgi:hypothetical protein